MRARRCGAPVRAVDAKLAGGSHDQSLYEELDMVFYGAPLARACAHAVARAARLIPAPAG